MLLHMCLVTQSKSEWNSKSVFLLSLGVRVSVSWCKTLEKQVTHAPIGSPNVILRITKQGSEILTSLDFEWSKKGWFWNGPYVKSDLKSGSPTIWNPDKWRLFCLKPFEIWMKMSGFLMVWTIAKAIVRPFWKWYHLNGWILDPHWC